MLASRHQGGAGDPPEDREDKKKLPADKISFGDTLFPTFFTLKIHFFSHFLGKKATRKGRKRKMEEPAENLFEKICTKAELKKMRKKSGSDSASSVASSGTYKSKSY
jgi:hypothetical protein